jgi:hypothetical protein
MSKDTVVASASARSTSERGASPSAGVIPSEVHQPRAPDRLPVHLRGRQPGERGISSVIENVNRARRDPVLEEIDADACPFRHAHVLAVHAVTGQLAPDALPPRICRKRRDPPGAKTEAGAGSCHVGLGAAELQIELANRLEASRRGGGEPQQNLAERDEIVHLSGLQADLD